MKKTIQFIFAITLMIMLFGCSGENDNTNNTGSKFVGGTTGLTLDWAPGSMPDTILDTEQGFALSVIVVNKGDHTIEDGADATVTISGIDPTDFGVSAAELTQDSITPIRGSQKDLEGNVIQGETVSYDFPSNGGNFEHQKQISGSVTYNIRADVCYKYETMANTKICVLEDILGTTGSDGKLCKINEDKTVDNSGAPVQVSMFRESVASANKVAFVLKVKHVGTGKVHETGSECEEEFQQKNKVHVKIDTGLSDGLQCSGLQDGQTSGSTYEGDTQLLSGEREIRCTQTINDPVDLEKLVQIELEYDYSQHISKTLEVQHVGA